MPLALILSLFFPPYFSPPVFFSTLWHLYIPTWILAHTQFLWPGFIPFPPHARNGNQCPVSMFFLPPAFVPDLSLFSLLLHPSLRHTATPPSIFLPIPFLPSGVFFASCTFFTSSPFSLFSLSPGSRFLPPPCLAGVTPRPAT